MKKNMKLNKKNMNTFQKDYTIDFRDSKDSFYRGRCVVQCHPPLIAKQ